MDVVGSTSGVMDLAEPQPPPPTHTHTQPPRRWLCRAVPIGFASAQGPRTGGAARPLRTCASATTHIRIRGGGLALYVHAAYSMQHAATK